MTKEEYTNKLMTLDLEYQEKCRKVHREFAQSNNKIRVGDIITDHYHTIKVETMKTTMIGLNRYPEMVYYGTQLTKKGDIAKRQTDTSMAQCNIKVVNGKEVHDGITI